MGYKVLYDNQLLFDPYTDDRITDTKLSSKLNAASYFDFTIAPTHSLYSKLKERAGEVRIYFNDLILFKGEITKIDEDFEGNYSVSCTGVLDYLTATRVRPYSTVEGEQPLKAPSSFDGYFQWLIDQHNSNCLDSRKNFSVGVNQGNMLDKNNYIYRSSEQRPTTASEIEDKILNSAGGYLFVRYQDDLNILDLYADVHDVNTQIIDYGVNMLNFTKTTTAEGQYTAVVATGYTPNPPEGQPDAKMKPITLEGCTDGGTPYSSTIVKMGDRVYDVEAVNRYGYHEYYVSNTDITTYDGLLYYACKTLNTLLSPALTISVKAVDLALIMGEKYKHLQLGQAVRIRSKPRKVDEYLMVNSIDLDLMNPENTTFDLGASYDTLTGQQSAYLKALNASINASLDTVDALSTNVKNSAKLAQEAKDKADTATDAAADAAAKADKVTDIANSAVNKAESAVTKADTAISTATDTKAKVTLVEKQATEAKAAADTAKKAADDATTAANSAQSSAAKANEAASNANTAASKAQSTANSALSSATQANKDVGNVKTQITEINKEMSSVKQDAANLRDDLTGQITTVKETMEADYTKKSELSATETNLKTEISKSAAGLRTEVSQTYSTKKELETTTKAAQTAQSTADAAKKAAESNASDLANAVSKFDGDISGLKDQIDGAIQTWFYDGIPNALTEPEVNWTTDKDRQTHLGDLYYDNKTGFCYRYMNQNGVYSWGRIKDTEVTKALSDAAKAQTTANAKKRIFITTPKPPYDIGDLWVQGSTGDIMRCQTPKLESQAYAEADWVKASKYTDDTAVTKLSNTVEKTYATKSTVNQLSDRIEQTVSSVEEVRTDASAAKTTANNAKKAADDAAAAANTAHETATAAQTAANKAQEHATSAATAASTAKANADAAQAAANKANASLAEAQKNLKTLQNRADVTDEELTAAKNAVASAQTAADSANSAASKAKELANTAQSTADTAKANATTAQTKANAAASAASTAQSTADTAKANAKKAQDDVNALKNRVTTAETKITQNSEAIALRATKTEMQSSINQTAESIKTTVSKEYTKITDAEAKYATKTSLTQTANDLTIDFDNKINNINKYVRFVDGNVILGEAGNPTTLKLTNDHLDILNKTNVVAKFAENTIELGNNSYLSEIKLCKGLATIQGYTAGGNDSDPLISIGASSGVRLYATREINAGHLTTGTFNVLTSSDASNSETTMSSSSFLKGNDGTILKEAAVSVNTSNTGDSACNITASKIRINSRDVFTLTKLWSGNLSRGGSVNVTQGSQYTLFAVRPSDEGLLMIGVKFKDELHCYASYDSGTETRQSRASFHVNGNTFRLTAASENVLNGANSGRNITEIYGLF
nr:MAG TPA: Putative tail protein [Caudoviricetes sp.]